MQKLITNDNRNTGKENRKSWRIKVRVGMFRNCLGRVTVLTAASLPP